MKYRLEALRGRGLAPRRWELEAPSAETARQQASAEGYQVLSCVPAGGWSLAALRALLSRQWSAASDQSSSPACDSPRGRSDWDIPVFVEQLRDLLNAGLSLIEALEALRRGANAKLAQLIDPLARALRAGQTLSDALAQHPDALFPPLLVALVRASEITSDLPDTLGRFVAHQRRMAELRHRLQAATIYPLLLVAVGLAVLLFLAFYVMPRFARIFDGMQGELPWAAQAMLAWSQFLAAHGGSLLVILLAAGLAAGLALARPGWRSRWAALLLAWPPLARSWRVHALARWYRGTGLLLRGGIPLPQALALAAELLPLALRRGAAAVELGVQQGLGPAAAYQHGGMSTAVAEQLLQAGERTGELGLVLERLADFHEAELGRSLERAMRAFEPLAMVGIGLGVGLLVVLMYLPIFELAAAVS